MRRAGRLGRVAAVAGGWAVDSHTHGHRWHWFWGRCESFSPLFTYLLACCFCGAQPSSPWEGLQGEVVHEMHSFLWLFPAVENCPLSQVTEWKVLVIVIGKMSLQLSFLLSSGSLQRTCALLFTLLGSQPLWLWYGHTVRNKFEPPRKRPPFQLKCLYRQNFNIDQVWTREILFLIKHTRPGNVLGFSSKAGADCLFHWRESHLSLSWLASFIRISTKEIRKGPATWVPRMQQGLCMNKSFTGWGIKAFTYTFYKVGEIKIWILCCTQKSYMFDRKG